MTWKVKKALPEITFSFKIAKVYTVVFQVWGAIFVLWLIWSIEKTWILFTRPDFMVTYFSNVEYISVIKHLENKKTDTMSRQKLSHEMILHT